MADLNGRTAQDVLCLKMRLYRNRNSSRSRLSGISTMFQLELALHVQLEPVV